MEDSVASQESVTKDLEKMVVHSRVSGSLESDSFKKPRTMSRRKPLPTGTIASEKLEYIDESFLPDNFILNLKIDEVSCKQPDRPLHGNYIVDLAAMVRSISDVASCKKCKDGLMEMFELESTDTCASKFLFRCDVCLNPNVFMNVGETNSGTTNLLDLTSVLSIRLVGLNSEKLRAFSSCMDLPPPPSRYHFPTIQAEVLIAAEKEAEPSMDRAKTHLETKLGIDPVT